VVVVRARPGTAIGLRRHATPLGPADDGDDRLQLRTTEPGQLADQLAAFGADVLVESPAEVRDAVLARLTRLAAMGVPA
jgi:proteasome accessory factor B